MSQSNKNKGVIFLIIFILICVTMTVIAIYLTNEGIITLAKVDNKVDEPKQIIKSDDLGIKTLEDRYNYNPLTLTTEEYHLGSKSENDFYYPIEVHYVQISGLKNISIQDKINKEIKETALAQIDDNELDKNNFKYVMVTAKCVGNFSNVLSIRIDKDYMDESLGKELENSFIGLNYNLKTGEKIDFTEMFTNDAGTKNIIAQSAYKTFAGEYLDYLYYQLQFPEESQYWDGDMNKIDYSEIEDRVFKVLQTYDRNNKYPFCFDERYIYTYIDSEEIAIEMRNFYSQIAIYNRYANATGLFEEEQNDFLVFLPNYIYGVVYRNVKKIDDNLFIDLGLVNWIGDDEYKRELDIATYIQDFEKRIEECKEYLKENKNQAIVLAVTKELYNGENGEITEYVYDAKAIMSKDYFNNTYLDRVLEWEQTDKIGVDVLDYFLTSLLSMDNYEGNSNIKFDIEYPYFEEL